MRTIPVRSAQTGSLRLAVLTALALASVSAYAQSVSQEEKTSAAPSAEAPASDPKEAKAGDETVHLSPFVVRESNKGYMATNTQSGTRLNTKLDDLGASISVITKQQISDFAMVDINDIFMYAGNTEGTATYSDLTIDRNGNTSDNVANNPGSANRVRGIGSANTSISNFRTSGRVPIDTITLDAVEISRGPNSSIFGLGNPSGTVNGVAATANLTKNTAAASFRVDSYGSTRETLDVSRVLIPGKLAVRASYVHMLEEFQRKPSGVKTDRLNLMVKAQPFKLTTLRVSQEWYKASGNRPNALTPRDVISYWIQSGKPSWDPTTQTYTLGDGTTTKTAPLSIGDVTSNTRPTLFVDPQGITYWSVTRVGAQAAGTVPDPANTAGAAMFKRSLSNPWPTALWSSPPPVTNRSLYDWTSINLAAMNRFKDDVKTTRAELDQFLLDGEVHKIAIQLGWQHEDAGRFNKNIYGNSENIPTGYNYLAVDVNSKLLDGSANPYFGRPYIMLTEPLYSEDPLITDTARAQAAYIVDFSKGNKSWMKWLGRHQLAGYAEEREARQWRWRWRDAIVDNHSWLAAGTSRGNQGVVPVSSVAARGNYDFYVGDASGYNVDYAPGNANPGTYTFNWYDSVNKKWVAEGSTIGSAASMDGAGGQYNSRNVIHTRGAMMQNTLLDESLVFTGGLRNDRSLTQFGNAAAFDSTGINYDVAAMRPFQSAYTLRSGRTSSKGLVFRPFKAFGLKFLENLSLFANTSNSFLPQTPAQSILRQMLPDSSSRGNDYGLSISLLHDKLSIRYNQYEQLYINSRAGDSGVIATRTMRLDFPVGAADPFNLVRVLDLGYQTAPGKIITDANARAEQVAKDMGLTTADIAQFSALPISETNDVAAKGREVEMFYNPNPYWTTTLSAAQTQSVNRSVSPNIPAWIAQRMSLWTSIKDPWGNSWWNTAYSGFAPTTSAATSSNTPGLFYQGVVVAPLAIATATQGKSRPQVREYSARLSTSYRLAGLTSQRFLKKMNVGGSLRWESRGAIGYYANADKLSLDANRPIWDGYHTYIDLFGSYRTTILKNKVGLELQLNIRNLQEPGGRLRPVSAFPDGTPQNVRIMDPRLFILETRFTF